MARDHEPASIEIEGRTIGAAHPPYVIAELSANHSGSFDRATETIEAAAAAGADAIKLQTYRADSMTLDLDRAPFVLGDGSPWAGRRLHDLYEEAATPWEWHEALFAAARANDIVCFSSPFDAAAVELLESLDCPAYKIASFELVDLALIRVAASTGKPIVMSTGMASAGEIDEAVAAATDGGAAGVALLRCNSTYPAPVDQMDLTAVGAMIERWNVPVGLSDHTATATAAITATALGASLIEKHFIIDRADGGPDAAFSIEPGELADLVAAVHDAWLSLGEPRFGPSPSEAESVRLRRSLWVVNDIEAGEEFSTDNVRAIRPAGGLAPKHLGDIVGRRTRARVAAGTPVSWELVE